MLSYQRILVPVDFTDISRHALLKAAGHSEASGSRLYVTHIIDPNSLPPNETAETSKKKALTKMDRLLDDAEVGYSEKLVEIGQTIPALLQIIESHTIDLVVIGTQHFNSLETDISVTKSLSENLECDILIIQK